MFRVWNVTKIDVVVPLVGKVRAGSCAVVPTMTRQLQHLLDMGFLTLAEPPKVMEVTCVTLPESAVVESEGSSSNESVELSPANLARPKRGRKRLLSKED